MWLIIVPILDSVKNIGYAVDWAMLVPTSKSIPTILQINPNTTSRERIPSWL